MQANKTVEQIRVTTHVGRTVLHDAALFKNAKSAIWEYVSNGLQYIDSGAKPTVYVKISKNRPENITIQDNGRGMDWSDLQNFFTMHGENVDRKQGNAGRGYFGTGKSAAFGIADKLLVTSVKNKKRSKVSITRSELRDSDGSAIPVREIEKEVPCNQKNGTIIEIENVNLSKKVPIGEVKKYIEGHIAKWPNATVYINDSLCEYNEPPIANEYKFEPELEYLPELKGALLKIKVAHLPIEEKEINGISIFSNGTCHETTLVEAEGREMSKYLFGEIDIPELSNDSSPIAPFTVSRDMKLNAENTTVAKAYDFIGRHLEAIRKKLVADDKERKQTEEQKKLKKEADKIADIINQDFSQFKEHLGQTRAKAIGSGTDKTDMFKPNETGEETPVFGNEDSAIIASEEGDFGGKENINLNTSNDNPPDTRPVVELDDKSPEKIAEIKKTNPKNKSNKGGFSVEFKNMGEEKRARYDHSEKVIRINLDHPQLCAALKNSNIDDPTFKRLAYEVAFCEYAIGLAYELVGADVFFEMDEPLALIRDTIDRITKNVAFMYEA